MSDTPEILLQLRRIAEALDRLSPPPPPLPAWDAGTYVWEGATGRLRPEMATRPLALDLLRGIDPQRATLVENTRRFAMGLPFNDALLWGARGMGKSALVKAAHAYVRAQGHVGLSLVEIYAHDVPRLSHLLDILRHAPIRAIVFCDDLAFTESDAGYRGLKALLEGGVSARPSNVVVYATSNRRHLMPREMGENERSSSIHPDEDVEESVSLSDRFGLWLGFHACTQSVYLEMVEGYAAAYALPVTREALHAQALGWAMGRSARSGRTAWQFIQNLAGELGVRINAPSA